MHAAPIMYKLPRQRFLRGLGMAFWSPVSSSCCAPNSNRLILSQLSPTHVVVRPVSRNDDRVDPVTWLMFGRINLAAEGKKSDYRRMAHWQDTEKHCLQKHRHKAYCHELISRNPKIKIYIQPLEIRGGEWELPQKGDGMKGIPRREKEMSSSWGRRIWDV